jgi:hypothetical protein
MGDAGRLLIQDERALTEVTPEVRRFCIICGRPADGTLDDGIENKAHPLCPSHLSLGMAGVPLRSLIWFD